MGARWIRRVTSTGGGGVPASGEIVSITIHTDETAQPTPAVPASGNNFEVNP